MPTGADAAAGDAGGRPQLIEGADLLKWAGVLGGPVALSWVLAVVCSPTDAVTTVSVVLGGQVVSFGWAGVWVVSCLGLGWLLRGVLGRGAPVVLLWTVGLTVQLFLAQLLGWLGLINGLLAWAPVAVGLGGLVWWAAKDGALWRVGPPPVGLVALWPGAALLLLCSVSPPGWLWASEFGGYDVLAYHLSLPRDWLAMGGIETLETNVYSALPSGMEGVWYQLGAMMGGADDPAGLIEAGRWATASQALHALIAMVGLGAIAAVVRGVLPEGRRPTASAMAAGLGILLATPWVLVTGSMSYNEMAVVALSAGAVLAAVRSEASVVTRSWVSGMLLAGACLAKPTALFLAGPTVAAVLLFSIPVRLWAVAVLPGVGAACVVLSPWLMRNGLATGNPVFPYATGVFGLGHWSVEQAERWGAGHAFDGSVVERLIAAVAPMSESGPEVERFRGVTNPQWGGFFLFAVVGAIVACVRGGTRQIGLALAVGLVGGLVSWMFLTHIQSRFLLPLVVPGGIAVVLAMRADRFRLGLTVGVLGLVAHSVLTVDRLVGERSGEAALAAVGGPGFFVQSEPGEDGPVSAKAFVNQTLGDDASVLLLGDAAGLYWLPRTTAVSTWDRHPIVGAIEAEPDDVDAWLAVLTEEGFTHLVVHPSELERLRASGWLDPALTAERAASLLAHRAVVARFRDGVVLDLSR